jgi:hypothetical protein
LFLGNLTAHRLVYSIVQHELKLQDTEDCKKKQVFKVETLWASAPLSVRKEEKQTSSILKSVRCKIRGDGQLGIDLYFHCNVSMFAFALRKII